jgi:putative transposase
VTLAGDGEDAFRRLPSGRACQHLDVAQGCSPDNAACEGFFGRLKTELFYPRQWQATAIEQFIRLLDSYIRWYNEKRIKPSLGSLSPLEYRESLGIAA